MKKILVSIVTLFVILAFPLNVFADKEEKEEIKQPVKVYLFWGNGCGYCEAAKTFFSELEKDYGDKFDLVDYEVWYNKDNNALKETVADYLNDTVTGVPYIVIGKTTFGGYSSEFDEDIIDAIKTEYAKEERVDVVAQIKAGEIVPEKNYDTIIVIGIFAVIIGGFGALIYFSRKQ